MIVVRKGQLWLYQSKGLDNRRVIRVAAVEPDTGLGYGPGHFRDTKNNLWSGPNANYGIWILVCDPNENAEDS